MVLKFTTIFSRVEGEAAVTVVPNHFFNLDKFGTLYSAPQLLRNEAKGYPRSCFRKNVIMRITVDAEGVASNPRLHRGDSNADDCIELMKRRIALRPYIPGMVHGVPTAMDHLYMVGWRGSWALSDRRTACVSRRQPCAGAM